MVLGLIAAGAALVFALIFARGNELAWLAGTATFALVPAAFYLQEQPALHMHGWLLLGLGAVALAVPLLRTKNG
jgi:hypothetical protein